MVDNLSRTYLTVYLIRTISILKSFDTVETNDAKSGIVVGCCWVEFECYFCNDTYLFPKEGKS